MSDPYLGEIRMWAFGWAPVGWAICNGALLPINQNQALFSILGVLFGGDGKVNFALPDLRGRTPVGLGTSSSDSAATYTMGNQGGLESVALTAATAPAHAHTLNAAATNGTAVPPAGALLANVVSAKSGSSTNFAVFLPPNTWTANAQLISGSVSTAGSGAAHDNMQPYTVINFAICVNGIYPQRD